MQRAIAAGPGIVVRAFSTRRAAAAMAGYRGPVTERIEEKLRATFNPTHLAIINESHTHAGVSWGRISMQLIVLASTCSRLWSLALAMI